MQSSRSLKRKIQLYLVSAKLVIKKSHCFPSNLGFFSTFAISFWNKMSAFSFYCYPMGCKNTIVHGDMILAVGLVVHRNLGLAILDL